MNFLTQQFINKAQSILSKNKVGNTSGGFQDLQEPAASNGKMLDFLQLNQDERDTRIDLHALDAGTKGYERLLVHCRDTDVLVLLTHYHKHLSVQEMSMCAGTRNTPRHIPNRAIRTS